MNKIKLAITEDHSLVRDGLKSLLKEESDLELCGVYACGANLLEGLKLNVPEVLLLDIQLPDYTGNQLARIISKEYPVIAILALTSMDSLYHIKDMMEHGCSGYLTKQADTEILLKAIKTVHAGGQYIDESLRQKWINSVTHSDKELVRLPSLTQREKEIIQMMADGLTNLEIAEITFISPRTVESHRLSLLQKLDAKNSLALIKKALQLGLVH